MELGASCLPLLVILIFITVDTEVLLGVLTRLSRLDVPFTHRLHLLESQFGLFRPCLLDLTVVSLDFGHLALELLFELGVFGGGTDQDFLLFWRLLTLFLQNFFIIFLDFVLKESHLLESLLLVVDGPQIILSDGGALVTQLVQLFDLLLRLFKLFDLITLALSGGLKHPLHLLLPSLPARVFSLLSIVHAALDLVLLVLLVVITSLDFLVAAATHKGVSQEPLELGDRTIIQVSQARKVPRHLFAVVLDLADTRVAFEVDGLDLRQLLLEVIKKFISLLLGNVVVPQIDDLKFRQ